MKKHYVVVAVVIVAYAIILGLAICKVINERYLTALVISISTVIALFTYINNVLSQERSYKKERILKTYDVLIELEKRAREIDQECIMVIDKIYVNPAENYQEYMKELEDFVNNYAVKITHDISQILTSIYYLIKEEMIDNNFLKIKLNYHLRKLLGFLVRGYALTYAYENKQNITNKKEIMAPRDGVVA